MLSSSPIPRWRCPLIVASDRWKPGRAEAMRRPDAMLSACPRRRVGMLAIRVLKEYGPNFPTFFCPRALTALQIQYLLRTSESSREKKSFVSCHTNSIADSFQKYKQPYTVEIARDVEVTAKRSTTISASSPTNGERAPSSELLLQKLGLRIHLLQPLSLESSRASFTDSEALWKRALVSRDRYPQG